MRNLLLLFIARARIWAICLFSTLLSCILFYYTSTFVNYASVFSIVCFVVVPIILHIIYTIMRPDPLIGPIAGSIAAVNWAGFVAGGTALAALRTHALLIDAPLAHADAFLYIDTVAFVTWIAFHPLISLLLNVAYLSTVPLLFATIIFLGLTQHNILMWDLCFTFVGSSTLCAFISAFIPAIGAFFYYQISSDILAYLPVGAGLFHLSTFEGYRSGALDTVDVRNLDGVVCFPSFHAAMAFMIAFALRNFSWLSVFSSIWCSFILISTIPIGGHYFIDVLAGLAVWAIFAQPALTRTVLFKLKVIISTLKKRI